MLKTRHVKILCALFAAILAAGPTAWAQDDLSTLPWRLGPGPGAEVTLPAAETVQGDVIRAGVPSLVFFTMLTDDFEPAFEYAALATAWQERHPGVQVVLVDTRTDAEIVRRWVAGAGAAVSVVADEDDAFEEAFDTNRLPIVYLLDEQGVVQDKIMGGSLERFIAFDQVLSWAAEGAWAEVAAQRSDWLTVGQAPSRALPEVPVGQGDPTVVYHTNPFCPPCEDVAEGLQAELNAFAERHPEVTVVILEEDARAGFDLEALRENVETFVGLYGREAAPGYLLLMVERGRIPGEEEDAMTLPEAGWAPTIKLVTYLPSDANDPNRWWGQVSTPGLMVFDAEGSYQGPAPLWLGFYEASALVASMSELLDNP